MNPYDRLSSLDASFLHLERPEYPMHVGAVSVLEGAPFFGADGRFRIDDVRDLVLSRLPLLPRFRRRLMHVPYEQGRPIWVDDHRFDITYHVRHTALPRPGTWEQLVALTTRVQEGLLDRDRPLWEIWLIEGVEGGNVALLQKTHHALVDGVSGVDVATLLLDMQPDFVTPVVPDWSPEPAPSASQLLLDTLRERMTEPAEIMRSFRSFMRGPRHAIERVQDILRSMSTLVTRDAIAPRTSLNARTGRHRRLAVVRIPLADVKEIRRGLGGTVNDVVLAGVSGGLRRLLLHRAEDTEDLQLPRALPGLGARRRSTWCTREQGLGDVRQPARRQPSGRRAFARHLRADRRPQGTPPSRRGRDVARDDRVRRADAHEPGRAGRAPAAVLQPHRHERSRAAAAALHDGRAHARTRSRSCR